MLIVAGVSLLTSLGMVTTHLDASDPSSALTTRGMPLIGLSYTLTSTLWGPPSCGVYTTSYVPSPLSFTCVGTCELRGPVTLHWNGSPPFFKGVPLESAAKTLKRAGSRGAALSSPGPSARHLDGSDTWVALTCSGILGRRLRSRVTSMEWSPSNEGSYSTTYVPSPMSVTLAGTAPLGPIMAASKFSPPRPVGLPLESLPWMVNFAFLPTCALLAPSPDTVHLLGSEERGRTSRSNGHPFKGLPSKDTFTLCGPVLVGWYMTVYVPSPLSRTFTIGFPPAPLGAMSTWKRAPPPGTRLPLLSHDTMVRVAGVSTVATLSPST
mmetsp:Transcript_27874/g.69894  ORF Transcript_27874/g.69894 Transcript_27874/m.69894 type:complete len:323 (-) Transcript_27874:852-1820(-)